MIVICWDYDGTLVSSELVYKNIFVNFLKKENLIVKNIDDKSYFSKYAGKHPVNVLKQLKEDGFVDKNFEITTEDLNKIFQKELRNSNNLILTPGLENVLEYCDEKKDILMAIVTSTYRADFEAKHNNQSVAKLKKYFDIDKNVYICGEIGNKELKPTPNGYLCAFDDILMKNNIKNQKNTLIMIEDSVSGCMSAKKAKDVLIDSCDIKIIGYLAANKYLKKEALFDNGADFVFDNSDELLKFIKCLSE